MKAALIALAVIMASGFAHAQWVKADHEHTLQELQHSGGTDKNGCHVDHRNGLYHCH